MYIILEKYLSSGPNKVMFVSCPPEISGDIISVFEKLCQETRYGMDQILGTTDDVNWSLKKRKFVLDISEYLDPVKFVILGGDTKYTIEGIPCHIQSICFNLTDQEIEALVKAWQPCENKKIRRTAKQAAINDEKLKYIKVIESQEFRNIILIKNILK